MRPCLNELQKYYCVKITLISLDWQWVTLISWCQTNHDIHSSPVMHTVEGKTHTILDKFKATSWKLAFLWEREKNILRSPVFTSVFILIQMIIPLYFKHIWIRVDFVFALLLTIQWFCIGFGLCKWKNKKRRASCWLQRKLNFSEQILFWANFMAAIEIWNFFWRKCKKKVTLL